MRGRGWGVGCDRPDAPALFDLRERERRPMTDLGCVVYVELCGAQQDVDGGERAC